MQTLTGLDPDRKLFSLAALFVEENGVYSTLPFVDLWGISLDARNYAGPYPVVAHPPCERWGRYWSGGPSAKVRRTLGDDNGCFASALVSVRTYGGVLEHPEGSHAWNAFSLFTPPFGGGWVVADDLGGWTCCVYQGKYGHSSAKATWLYAHGVELPSLLWGPARGMQRLDEGFHSSEARRLARSQRVAPRERLSHKQRLSTPIPFRDLLVSIALTAKKRALQSPQGEFLL